MAATLNIEADDERDELRQIVTGILDDYPFSPDLEGIEWGIARLTACARALHIAEDGHGSADDSVLAVLCEEEGSLVEAIAYETSLVVRVTAPDADPKDWRGATLAESKMRIEAFRDQLARELELCRRLIARAESVA